MSTEVVFHVFWRGPSMQVVGILDSLEKAQRFLEERREADPQGTFELWKSRQVTEPTHERAHTYYNAAL